MKISCAQKSRVMTFEKVELHVALLSFRRYPITAAIPVVEEHPVSQPLPASSTLETLTQHHQVGIGLWNQLIGDTHQILSGYSYSYTVY